MTTIIVSDPLRKEAEKASDGKCTVIRTPKGNPSYMNILSRFQCEEISDDLGTGLHPAFISAGKEIELLVGTYPAVIMDGEALSLPWQVPHRSINLPDARRACVAAGCHLMTNWESAALALWCIKNNFIPKGNTDWGKSHSHPEECGIKSGDMGITLTGSGPASWRHDGTLYGVADLVGNVWEWRDGLTLSGGEILMPADNDFTLPESEWPNTGARLDGVGGICISDVITERGWINTPFRDLTVKDGYDVPAILKQALLYPCNAMTKLKPETLLGHMWADNSEGFKAAALRGGYFSDGADAGVFSLDLSSEPSYSDYYVGFRACKVL